MLPHYPVRRRIRHVLHMNAHSALAFGCQIERQGAFGAAVFVVHVGERVGRHCWSGGANV